MIFMLGVHPRENERESGWGLSIADHRHRTTIALAFFTENWRHRKVAGKGYGVHTEIAGVVHSEQIPRSETISL